MNCKLMIPPSKGTVTSIVAVAREEASDSSSNGVPAENSLSSLTGRFSSTAILAYMNTSLKRLKDCPSNKRHNILLYTLSSAMLSSPVHSSTWVFNPRIDNCIFLWFNTQVDQLKVKSKILSPLQNRCSACNLQKVEKRTYSAWAIP